MSSDTMTFRLRESTDAALHRIAQSQGISKGETARAAIEAYANLVAGSDVCDNATTMLTLIDSLKTAGVGIVGAHFIDHTLPISECVNHLINLMAQGRSQGLLFFKKSTSAHFDRNVCAVLKKYGFSDDDQKIVLANIDQVL